MMKLIFLMILFLLASLAHAKVFVKEVRVDCFPQGGCASWLMKLDNLKNEYRNLVHLRRTLKVVASEGGMKNFEYTIDREGDNLSVNISLEIKKTIQSITWKVKDSSLKNLVEQSSLLKVDQYYEVDRLNEEEIRLKQYLMSKGYVNPEVTMQALENETLVDLTIKIEPGAEQILTRMNITTDSPRVLDLAQRKLIQLQKKKFDSLVFRTLVEELESDLFSYGYFLASVSYSPRQEENKVIVDITVKNTEQYVFSVKTNGTDSKFEFGTALRQLFKRYKRPLDSLSIDLAIKETLKKSAYLRPEVKVKILNYKNRDKESVVEYQIEIKPGLRTRLARLSFNGSAFYDNSKLVEMFNAEAFEMAQAGYYDEDYYTFFSSYLKNEYIKHGYVRAEVLGPQVSFSVDNTISFVDFTIVEGARVSVDHLEISGVGDTLENELLEKIETKLGSPFNPFDFANDLKTLTDLLQDKGYYYAEVTNQDSAEIVQYSANKSSMKIFIQVKLNKMITLNRVLIVGNKKTKTRIIQRRIFINPNDLLTPKKAKEIETSISSTGLFNSVQVSPIPNTSDESSTDLLVQVVERDYGVIELAPGFRTDIGLKLSGQITYANLMGENKAITLSGQVNQRLNYQTFDPRRRAEKEQLIEYLASLQYTQSDIWNSYVDYGLGGTFQRKRFYSFDADIKRVNNTFTRDFYGRYSFSLRHQYESINQFDATQARDNGSFVIGAITPSITADFRNSRINPTKGAFFNASVEYANPLFLSQNKEDLKIDFYKLVTRNRFYVPFKNGTIAISTVVGVQENLARTLVRDGSGQPVVQTDGTKQTDGYIPNIKVFRLTGTDIVRGFTDEEINRLPNGKDIGDNKVQNRAFMANFKIEPRYFINDTFIGGVFLDAGRVYVDQVDLGELRQSAGVTFKILTPVGTLDFDYGLKLLRKRNSDGSLESPGRFHVSIGFF